MIARDSPAIYPDAVWVVGGGLGWALARVASIVLDEASSGFPVIGVIIFLLGIAYGIGVTVFVR